MKDWIKWEGHECPVPEGTLVDIILRGRQNDKDIHRIKVQSEDYSWSYVGSPKYGHIIAYRIHIELDPGK